MSIIIREKGHYKGRKGDVFMLCPKKISSINVLTQGKVDAYILLDEPSSGIDEKVAIKSGYRLFSLNKNSFPGFSELFLDGNCAFSYAFAEDSSFYAFPVNSRENINALLKAKPDYSAFMLETVNHIVSSLYLSLNKVRSLKKNLLVMKDNLALYFWAIKKNFQLNMVPVNSAFNLGENDLKKLIENSVAIPAKFNELFLEKDFSAILGRKYLSDLKINVKKIDYYKRFSAIPFKLRKFFFDADVFLADYHFEDGAKLINALTERVKKEMGDIKKIFKLLYAQGSESLFDIYQKASDEIRVLGKNNQFIKDILEYLGGKLKNVISLYETEFLHTISIDKSILTQQIAMVSGTQVLENKKLETDEAASEEPVVTIAVPPELVDSAKKIIIYSQIDKEKGNAFYKHLMAFRKVDDKMSSDGDVRKIRKGMANIFFDIYEKVYLRARKENNQSHLINMFLNFSYFDEKLLKPDHLRGLYQMVDNTPFDAEYPVYHMRDWLDKIIDMSKDPSVDDFGVDYFAAFREMKKRRQVTDADKESYLNDAGGRLHYEIFNMLKKNQRLCFGQLSVYSPVLHSDMITKDLNRAFISKADVVAGVKRILSIDYSAYHREVLYRKPELGIEREFIMKRVIPDIVLQPTFGSRGFMWQDIEGRDKNSRARFMLPIFTSEDLFQLLVEITGAFRWEMVKTILGPKWNDVSESSLTADYTDYIQFFKKNRKLSDETKEKIKIQIKKARNNMRDIFVTDYILWVTYEYKGIMRLNTVSREVFYRHCPFPKAVRDKLAKQPMFSNLSTRFQNIRLKAAKKLTNKYHRYTKSGGVLDPELEKNLIFFRDE